MAAGPKLVTQSSVTILKLPTNPFLRTTIFYSLLHSLAYIFFVDWLHSINFLYKALLLCLL